MSQFYDTACHQMYEALLKQYLSSRMDHDGPPWSRRDRGLMDMVTTQPAQDVDIVEAGPSTSRRRVGIAFIVVAATATAVALGVTFSRPTGEEPVKVPVTASADETFVLFRTWSKEGCDDAGSLKHQAAFAPGECLSAADNGFGGDQRRRFMFVLESGEIKYREWLSDMKCEGTPDVDESRKAYQVVLVRSVLGLAFNL